MAITPPQKATRKIAAAHHQQVAPHPDAWRGSTVEEAIKKGDRDAALKAMKERRAGADAGRAAQYHSQEQCEPEGVGA